jgi:hypothetical protein
LDQSISISLTKEALKKPQQSKHPFMSQITKANSGPERLSPLSTTDLSPTPQASPIGNLANHQVKDITTQGKKAVSFSDTLKHYESVNEGESAPLVSSLKKVNQGSQLSGPASGEVINLSREITAWASKLQEERDLDSKQAKIALTYLEKRPQALMTLPENTKQELKAWSHIAEQRANNAGTYISMLQLRSRFLSGEKVNAQDFKKADSHIYCGTHLEDLKEDWESMKQDEKWAQEDTSHNPIKKIALELARKYETSTQMEAAKDTMRAMALGLNESLSPTSRNQTKLFQTPPSAESSGSENDSDPDSQSDLASPSGRYRTAPGGTPDYETGPLDMHGDPIKRGI